MPKSSETATRPNHDAIAKRAYELYLQRGSVPGHELDDWLQAEAELSQRRGGAAPPSSAERPRRRGRSRRSRRDASDGARRRVERAASRSAPTRHRSAPWALVTRPRPATLRRMGGHEAKLTGPDLEAGIPEADLAGETPLLGHARGEAVLLVRRGDEVLRRSARPARTTAARSPRGWSSATRSAAPGTTPASICAPARRCARPALNPIPCYDVARRRRPDPGRRAARAGRSRCGAARRCGPSPSSAPARPASRRPRRCAAKATTARSCCSAPTSRRPSIARTCRRTTWPAPRPRSGCRCGRPRSSASRRSRSRSARASTAIDPAASKLTLADGREVAWDALLLATGAEPVRPPLPGADQPHVLHAAHAGRQPRHHRSAPRARQARGRHRRQLHRHGGGGVAARARPRGRTSSRPRRCRSSARSAPSWAASCAACTRSTASASTSGRR